MFGAPLVEGRGGESGRDFGSGVIISVLARPAWMKEFLEV